MRRQIICVCPSFGFGEADTVKCILGGAGEGEQSPRAGSQTSVCSGFRASTLREEPSGGLSEKVFSLLTFEAFQAG